MDQSFRRPATASSPGSLFGRHSARAKAALCLLLIFSGLAGFAATAYWLGQLGGAQLDGHQLALAAAALAATLAVTCANLGLRWLRWHFLTREAGARLSARESLLAWVATLPAILTPFYVGELVRALLLGRKYPSLRSPFAAIWVLERATDLLVLSVFFAAGGEGAIWPLLFGVLWLTLIGGIKSDNRSGPRAGFPRPFSLIAVLGVSIASWLLPGLALWETLRLLGEPVAFPSALAIFSYSSVLGALSGLPQGVGITGSVMISELQGAGVSLETSILGTAVFRYGTAWFAVALGFGTALVFRRRLQRLFQRVDQDDHFDEIADAYSEMIPAHVRDRLLDRKVKAMRKWAAANGVADDGRGLDLGCGQGWYATAMAKLGYAMTGIDRSHGQIAGARRHAASAGVQVAFEATSSDSLPFEDDSFDFVYAINVLHHVVDLETRKRTFDEIVRVLRPGGVFFLHEMNTDNPFFRLYMSYLFPLLRRIDEGTEEWIRPRQLPAVSGASWSKELDYFTFLPDFVPQAVLRSLRGVEAALERSWLRSWSAHYVAMLQKPDYKSSRSASMANRL